MFTFALPSNFVVLDRQDLLRILWLPLASFSPFLIPIFLFEYNQNAFFPLFESEREIIVASNSLLIFNPFTDGKFLVLEKQQPKCSTCLKSRLTTAV